MRSHATAAGRSVRPEVAALLASAALLGACGADDDKAAVQRPFRPATVPATTSTLPAGTVTTAKGTPRRAPVADARKAVAEDRYAAAEQTFAALTAGERRSVRARIADRI